jgi:hypothetical protein
MGGAGLLVLCRDGGTGKGGKSREGGRRSETASVAVESGGVLKALSGAGEVVRRLAPRHPSTLLLLLSLAGRPLPLHLLVNLSPDVGETLARSERPTRAAPRECSQQPPWQTLDLAKQASALSDGGRRRCGLIVVESGGRLCALLNPVRDECSAGGDSSSVRGVPRPTPTANGAELTVLFGCLRRVCRGLLRVLRGVTGEGREAWMSHTELLRVLVAHLNGPFELEQIKESR